MYAQQQQHLILQQQNLQLPTLNSNAMMQPPPCCPGQVVHTPATQNQQIMRPGPMCQLPRQACLQQVLAPHHPQGAPGAVCFPQPGNELYMRNSMTLLPTGQHQTYHRNMLWPGQSNGEASPFPGGAQSPAAHQPVVCQAWPNPHLHQTITPTNPYQNPESPPRRHTEPSYSQETQITLQVIPSIPGNSEDATDVQATTASTDVFSATGSCDSEDRKTSSGIRACGPRVSFSAQSPESTDSESELPTLAKQSVEQGPTEPSATDCSSPRCNGKNVPSHSLDDLFEEDEGIANFQQGSKPAVRSAPSRKGSRPQILTLRNSVAYVANDNDCMICQRGREGSISRAPLDPSLFATEEEDQEARERRQREADDEKATRQTQSAGHARRGECIVSPFCLESKLDFNLSINNHCGFPCTRSLTSKHPSLLPDHHLRHLRSAEQKEPSQGLVISGAVGWP